MCVLCMLNAADQPEPARAARTLFRNSVLAWYFDGSRKMTSAMPETHSTSTSYP